MTEMTEMTEKAFEAALMEGLRAALPEQELSRERIEKLQGQSYEALVLRAPGSAVGVSLRLDRYSEMKEKGSSMEEILEAVLEDFREAGASRPEIDTGNLRSYEDLKKLLTLRLVPVRGNEELLAKVPHRRILDLAAVCRILLRQDEHGEASILLTEENLRMYGITEGQLFADAERIAPETQPPSVRSMSSVLFGTEEEGTGLWVVSNQSGRYGAGVLAYPGTLKETAERLGSGFYLIPSSVHELLALPDDSRLKAAELDGMVRAVNTQEVIPEERLSDHAYHYDPEEDRFESAADYEARKLQEQTA